MRSKLQVGDRVVKRGWKTRDEPDRFGEVVECYHGVPSACDPGVPFVAVKWDDTGTVERGYINGVALERYLAVPTVWFPETKAPQ